MKKFLNVMFGAALMGSALTAAADDISGNVTLATDYRFRGISQDHGKFSPAIQGGFDWSKEGFYVGTWGSNIAFAGSLENDWYLGYNGKVNDNLGYSVGYIYYYYPKAGAGPNVSFSEVNASVTFQGLTAGISYSNDFTGETGKATYYNLGYDLGLPNDFGLNFHYGYQAVKDNAALGVPDYSDYSIGLSKSYGGLDFGLTWYDTNISEAECFGGSNACKSRVTFSVGKSL